MFMCFFLAMVLIALCVALPYSQVKETSTKETAFDAVTRATPKAELYFKLGIGLLSDVSTYDALTFDPRVKEYGEISYKLARQSRIRVRIVLRRQANMVIRTLVDMEERPAGRHVEKWDSKDQSGNLVDNTKCFFVIQADPPPHDQHPRERCKELRVDLLLSEPRGDRRNKLPVRLELGAPPSPWMLREVSG